MYDSAKFFLNKWNNIKPDFAVILGSGLTNFFEEKNIISSISYEDLPDFPKPTVKGHPGKLVLGNKFLKAEGPTTIVPSDCLRYSVMFSN